MFSILKIHIDSQDSARALLITEKIEILQEAYISSKNITINARNVIHIVFLVINKDFVDIDLKRKKKEKRKSHFKLINLKKFSIDNF